MKRRVKRFVIQKQTSPFTGIFLYPMHRRGLEPPRLAAHGLQPSLPFKITVSILKLYLSAPAYNEYPHLHPPIAAEELTL